MVYSSCFFVYALYLSYPVLLLGVWVNAGCWFKYIILAINYGIEVDLKPKVERQSKDFFNLVLRVGVGLCRAPIEPS